MKYYLTIILSLILSLPLWAQDANWKMELSLTHDFLNRSYGKNFGYLAKGKKYLLSSNHFDLLAGAAFQNHYINESKNMFTDYVDGYTRDVGFYFLFDANYFPFHKKKFYLSIEHFAGVTNLYSKGKLDIPHLEVHEDYKNSYTYFNYGLNQSLGLQFRKINVSCFVWVSFKGFLDDGRTRPADFDSRLLPGFNVGYRF